MAAESMHTRTESNLLELLCKGSDVELVFEDDTGRSLQPCHSQILSAWSGVLAGALDTEAVRCSGVSSCSQQAEAEGRGSSHSCSHSWTAHAAAEHVPSVARRIPMPGTSREEFLEVAAFMYPVIPPAQVTWSNLEMLLMLGAKYDLPAILVRAAAFIGNHMCLLDMVEGGSRFIWKWLPLLDAAGLDDVCNQCIQRAVRLDRTSCSVKSRLLGLSNRALQQLVLCLASSNPSEFGTARTRISYSGVTGASSGNYKLYHSAEVASILDQSLP